MNRDGRLVYRSALTDPPLLWDYLTHLLLWDSVKEQKLPTVSQRPTASVVRDVAE